MFLRQDQVIVLFMMLVYSFFFNLLVSQLGDGPWMDPVWTLARSFSLAPNKAPFGRGVGKTILRFGYTEKMTKIVLSTCVFFHTFWMFFNC